jgi:hypothetical protein
MQVDLPFFFVRKAVCVKNMGASLSPAATREASLLATSKVRRERNKAFGINTAVSLIHIDWYW